MEAETETEKIFRSSVNHDHENGEGSTSGYMLDGSREGRNESFLFL